MPRVTGPRPNNHQLGKRKMTIHNKLWVLVLLCFLPASALAASSMADVSDEGAYVALNVGRATMMQGCKAPVGVVGASCVDSKAYGYFATFGYQYTSMWGLEVNYGKIGNVSSTGYYLRTAGLSLSAVASLHMTDAFAVFAKAGATYADFRQDPPATAIMPTSSGYSPSGGIGVELDVSPKLALRAQADYFGGYTIYTGSPKVHILVNSVGMVVKY